MYRTPQVKRQWGNPLTALSKTQLFSATGPSRAVRPDTLKKQSMHGAFWDPTLKGCRSVPSPNAAS